LYVHSFNFWYSSENYLRNVSETDFIYYEVESDEILDLGSEVDFKELMFSPEEIVLTGKDYEVFLRINEKSGIEIYSVQPVKITSKEGIEMDCQKKIILAAQDEINIGCKKARYQ
jgi:hypothetical protein